MIGIKYSTQRLAFGKSPELLVVVQMGVAVITATTIISSRTPIITMSPKPNILTVKTGPIRKTNKCPQS